MSQVELGFLLESLSMPIDKILPSRQVPAINRLRPGRSVLPPENPGSS